MAVPAADLALGLLADNGGPTPTHALLAGSIAIDGGTSPCPATDQRGFDRVDGACDVGAYEFTPLTASGIDVMPGSQVNPVNSRKKGVIPVVLFGTPDLDVARVDFRSLAFGPDGAAPAHRRVQGHREDVNGDGFMDLVAHFRAPDIGLAPGDTMACLSATTVSGERLEGCDTVRVK